LSTSFSSFFESLGSDDVTLLMRAIKKHKELLEASAADIDRGRPIAYVLDYNLLHVYLFEQSSNPTAAAEVGYVFDRLGGQLFLGVGTLVELEEKFHARMHLDLSRLRQQEPDLDTLRSATWADFDLVYEHLERTLQKEPEKILALANLRQLLEDGRIGLVDDVLRGRTPDASVSAFEDTFKILERLRKERELPNLVDAVNLSHVVAMRELSLEDPTVPYGFYLSRTVTLLRPPFTSYTRDLGVVFGGGDDLARTPLTALHSERAARVEPEPDGALRRVNELLTRASVIEYQLQRAPGFVRDDVRGTPIDAWEHLAPSRLTPAVREQAGLLDIFVGDALVLEMQQLVDSAELLDWNALHERAGSEAGSPQQLFDLISSIARGLPSGAPERLPDLWRRVVGHTVQQNEGFDTHSFCGSGRGNVYLEVEKHPRPYWVIRWPTHTGPEAMFKLFVSAFQNHEQSEIVVGAGTRYGTHLFDAELPLVFGDVVEAVREPITWIRLEGSGFALYGDVVPNTTARPPVIGVLAERPIREHVAGLYAATSARFLFRSWIDSMLEHAGVPSTGSPASRRN
jgi:hypothetical protein